MVISIWEKTKYDIQREEEKPYLIRNALLGYINHKYGEEICLESLLLWEVMDKDLKQQLEGLGKDPCMSPHYANSVINEYNITLDNDCTLYKLLINGGVYDENNESE